MPGELALDVLLNSLKVTAHPATFVFATIKYESPIPIPFHKIQMAFRETEGVTLILDKTVAEEYSITDYTFPSTMLTCEVHSSLEAVGFMAIMARQLADEGIGCNPVSGYYHDHLFVPENHAEQAVKILQDLASGNRND